MSDRSIVAALLLLVCAACVNATSGTRKTGTSENAPSAVPRTVVKSEPPAYIVGDFEDDYGARFSVSRAEFFQRSRNHFHVVEWNAREQYLVAQNDSLNASDAGRWTRIDWMPLSGMQPFEWAFCFSAYKAATRAEAMATSIAQRSSPRTGCNGFPFTRMKRLPGI